MTAASLKRIVEEALAEVGANVNFLLVPKGKARSTTWLGIEHGFGIRHYPSGRNVYIVQTRMAGRLRTVTIGPASVLTRHQAQMVARRVIAYAQVGRDPATDRKRIRSAPRFDDFLEEYWSRWSPQWKASTLETHNGYRRQYLDRAFKGIFIDELNEEHVTKWFADLNNRTGPGAANRTLEILKNMLNKAEVWGYRLYNTNPCRSVRPNKRRQCERFLSAEELARFGEVLAELRASDNLTIRSGCAVITLLLLTGCRYREILTLQWQDVKGNRLLLRDSKTGPRTVWLGSAARQVIDSLPRHPKIPWLFWNYQYRRPIGCIQHLWRTILERADLGKLRIHDLRHTFASHAAMSKETLPMIGRLLGHANHQSTARYAHLDDGHLLDAAQQIGTAVERQMGAPLKLRIGSDILEDVPRVVLDTDVIVTALRSATGGSNAVLREAAHGRLTPLVTPALFLEYEAVLKRPEQRLAHGLGLRDIDRFLAALASACEAVEVSFQWRPQLSDPNDEMVLETAVNGRADALITHNVRDFAKGATRFGLRVLRPGELLKELRS